MKKTKLKRVIKPIMLNVILGAICAFLFSVSNIIPVFGPGALAIYFGKEKVTSIDLHRFLKNYFKYFMVIGESAFWIALYIISPTKSIASLGLIIGIIIISCVVSGVVYFFSQLWFKPRDYTISCT